ncbi:hypothetical protein DRV85_06315 [Rhodosalinus halophilus]|uniref:Uncharacterized protein n=1 Tax=Rhodosalinus halophilus TaxID=2259333 RepID=A0A365UCK5_9RHOB|nr:hypothetical protein [Rhodosalinus halophilus]RBI86358.1 hypothetical protein DRV85_06315 [Rhodosalinus halophilus]
MTDPTREAEAAAQAVTEEARDAVAEAREAAARSLDEAGRRAREEANARVSQAADDAAAEAANAARAAEDAAAEFGADSVEAKALRSIAQFLEDTAERLHALDLESMVHGVDRFAQRHPMAFLAGAAALGFAAARLLRAADRADASDAAPGPSQSATSAGFGGPAGAVSPQTGTGEDDGP